MSDDRDGEDHNPDEQDVDLDDEIVLSADTIPEGVEFVGEFGDLESYFRRELEDLVDSSVHWALDCLDYEAVQRKMEDGRYRYLCENGSVYRLQNPQA